MADIVKYLDEVISSNKLRKAPLALLLLKLSQVFPLFSLETGKKYWQELQKIKGHMPAKYRKEYQGLKSMYEKPEKVAAKGFLQLLMAEIITTSAKIEKEPQQAKNELINQEMRLKKRFWPFGKSPLWNALINAWIKLDRKQGLRLSGKIPKETLKNYLIQMNSATPLAIDEWEIVQKSCGSARSLEMIIEDILGEKFSKLSLPENLAKGVAAGIKKKMLTFVPDMKLDKRIDELIKYKQLVLFITKDKVELSCVLMEDLYQAVANQKQLFGEDFPSGFSLLAQVINVWALVVEDRETMVGTINRETPKFLADYALAQCYGITSKTEEQAREAYNKLLKMPLSSKENAEAWFLITLVKNELSQTALTLARESKHKTNLLPRLYRAMLCLDPEKARELFNAGEVEEDLIDKFLRLPGNKERLEFLKEQTKNGTARMPKELWGRPELGNIALFGDEASNKSLMNIYMKDTKEDDQFKVVLRLHGYGYYSHEEIDIYLLSLLVFWFKENPKELESLMKLMWEAMQPSTSDLQLDIIRNHIFERCRTVLAAHPETLTTFINWVKKTLVDKALQWQNYQTTYTLSLPATAPLLFALLAAEKVAKMSAKTCDDILINALKAYQANDELMAATAKMYASDKGLNAAEPPAKLSRNMEDCWQIAVVEVSFPNIVRDLFEQHKMI